jgi:prepilin-type N-terminal cleavage/methylation domain-containing protein
VTLENAMPARPRGFTLIELLVVIAIIVILVSLVLVSFRSVRSAAGRADSLGALRQMGAAHALYTQDQNGQLLPGYVDAALFAQGALFEDLKPRLADGTVLDIADRQSYVWRLAPYVDGAWQTFFADVTSGALSGIETDFGQGIHGPAGGNSPNHAYAGNLSERPAFGLNSIFVGGDSVHGGSDVVARNPWNGTMGKIAATRLTEVKNPSSLIVFAPAARAGGSPAEPYDQPEAGFCELRPPYVLLDNNRWKGAQWLVDAAGRVITSPSGEYSEGAGLPIDRRGVGRIPVVHLDGSATVDEIATLSGDMRRWNPYELALRETVP